MASVCPFSNTTLHLFASPHLTFVIRLSFPSLIAHLTSFLYSLSLCSSPSDQHGASKPPLSSSAMTSRILLRQQLMREQLQEQERREQQRQQSSHYPQTTATQTPAINVSVPVSVSAGAQVPMEVLKVSSHGCRGGDGVWRHV